MFRESHFEHFWPLVVWLFLTPHALNQKLHDFSLAGGCRLSQVRPGPKLAGVDWRLEVLVVGGSREKLMGKIAWGCGHFRVKPLSPEALVD